MEIRKANTQDIPEILAFGKNEKAFQVVGTDSFWGESELRYLIENDVVFVAIEDKIVGFTIATHHKIKSIIENVFVSPDVRKKGLGIELMYYTEKELKQRGTLYIVVETLDTSSGMMHLLKKIGYYKGQKVHFWAKMA